MNYEASSPVDNSESMHVFLFTIWNAKFKQ